MAGWFLSDTSTSSNDSPSGSTVAEYPMDNISGSTLPDRSGNNNDGTIYGASTVSGLDGTSGALSFDGADDYCDIPRTIGDSFTILFSFSSTGGTSTSSRWFKRSGLVDMELGGASVDDFGTSLNADGQVLAGVGPSDDSSDTFLTSSTGFNDGTAHRVEFERDGTTGDLKLIVDGTTEDTATAGTATLDGSSTIDIGRIHTDTHYFDGIIDEVELRDSI